MRFRIPKLFYENEVLSPYVDYIKNDSHACRLLHLLNKLSWGKN